ncbi:TatD family hydrolase [Deinococcus ruber]|uniref:Deoxyribonuclease n=1 Tax=Deinococcus ruber TaxID=1848197 RepID=A0A918C7Y9_9DEIO|nr:TatD family hydrolase [Deinococcus ruber]GGR08299.1 deoxyribonuclease [Deinococcus ruber]
MIDTHCHLDYLEDPGSALSELNLSGAVCIGASPEHARSAVALAEQFAQVWATVGIHPTDAAEHDTPAARAELERLALHPRVVGIGESGLDDYWAQDARAAQQAAFEWQCDLARRVGKPLVIHTRDRQGQESAHLGVIETLKAHADVTAILHCFSGHRLLLEAGLERGDYFGFAGNTTYKNAQEIQAAAREVPLNRLLLETDAPFLAPVPRRGKPNRPGYVRYTLEFVAALRGMDAAELERITDENARRVYGI